ncbi:MAG: HAMP domain-containing histidine kinase [Paludibacter sp.]|nr:HAMP domain-containing histidine kinase [Paludibacter sp.]
MSPKHISYIAGICLLLIMATQGYLVYDYFKTTDFALTRETDDILLSSFRKDLTYRNKAFEKSRHEDTITIIPPPNNKNTIKVDLRKSKSKEKSVIGQLDLVINTVVSTNFPINLRNLDSITGTILASRQIHSAYIINLVDPTNNQVLQQSKKGTIGSFLVVPSKLLQIDLENKKSLQLILVNPFGIIIKRMGLLLLSSLVLSVICLFAFRFLLITLAQQKKLVAFKNEFLGTIAHELKRPVASLTVNLDCMTMQAFADDKAKRELLVSKSINATTELNDTIRMIVALAKVEEGLLVLNKQQIDLRQLFEELKTRFVNNAYKGVVIQTAYETEELMLLADVQLLSQCFANLIDNAIKYSDNEVQITITLRKEANRIAIWIKDNGFGISPEKLPSIFEKYSRAHTNNTKINGYGIGLNYVKTIVEKHKGEVSVQSKVGVGSEFIIKLVN